MNRFTSSNLPPSGLATKAKVGKSLFSLILLLFMLPLVAISQTPASALNFDGIDDRVQGSDAGFPMGNQPRTIEAWVKVASVTTHGNILVYGSRGVSSDWTLWW